MSKKKNIKLVLFFNNIRGLNLFNFLKKNNYNIYQIYLSKKNLNLEIVKFLKKKKITFKVIKKIEEIEIEPTKKFIGIICGFPYIFKENQIKLFYKLINCHAGRLPHYRGGSPLNWQLINGEKRFWISVIFLTKLIDAGNVIAEKSFEIKDNFTIIHLHKIAIQNFPKLVESALKKIMLKKKGRKQEQKLVKYYRQRSKSDSILLFKDKSYNQIFNFVRALQGNYPKAYFLYKKKKILISTINKSKKYIKSGKIKIIDRKFYIGCKDTTILINN